MIGSRLGSCGSAEFASLALGADGNTGGAISFVVGSKLGSVAGGTTAGGTTAGGTTAGGSPKAGSCAGDC